MGVTGFIQAPERLGPYPSTKASLAPLFLLRQTRFIFRAIAIDETLYPSPARHARAPIPC